MKFNKERTVLSWCNTNAKGQIIIPEGIAEIADYAFNGCKGIESISCPKSLRKIGMAAFKDCISLKKVVFKYGLETIEGMAFYNCKNLTDISFPKSLKLVGEYSFANCPVSKKCVDIKEKIQVADTAFGELDEKDGQCEDKQIEADFHKKNSNKKDFVSKGNRTLEILHIYKVCSCAIKKHKIENCYANVMNVKNGQRFNMNVHYCMDCKKYMIDENSFNGYIKKGNIPAVRLVDEFSKYNNGFGNVRKEKSIMALYGYTVQVGKLTKKARRRIITFLLDNHISTKEEIISILNDHILYNGKKKNNAAAKTKWEEDKKYVCEYKVNEQRRVSLIYNEF